MGPAAADALCLPVHGHYTRAHDIRGAPVWFIRQKEAWFSGRHQDMVVRQARASGASVSKAER